MFATLTPLAINYIITLLPPRLEYQQASQVSRQAPHQQSHNYSRFHAFSPINPKISQFQAKSYDTYYESITGAIAL